MNCQWLCCGAPLNFGVRRRMSQNQATGRRPDYSEAWRALQIRDRTRWAIVFGGIPIALLLSFPSFRALETPYMCCWFSAIAIAGWYYVSFPCPKCHKAFFKPTPFGYNTFLKKCSHCGLEKNGN